MSTTPDQIASRRNDANVEVASTDVGKIPAPDRVPFWQKIAYGAGGSVEGPAVWVPSNSIMPVFNLGMGMNPAVVGLILMLWRGWDACFDPIMGNISDNTRTRWGRRRPFIVAGAIMTALTMPLIWWTPHWLTEAQMFWWLLAAGLIFYTCYSTWAMPYYSLQLEMSPNYDERTNITAFRAFAQKVTGLAAGWDLAVAGLPVFSHLPEQKPDLVNGMRYVGLFMAVFTIVLGVLPGLFVKERYYEADVKSRPKQNLLKGLGQTLTNRAFLWIIVIVFTNTFGYGLVSSLGFYVNAFYICHGDLALATKIQGVKASLIFVPGLFAIPFCTWLSRRFDKHMLLYLTCGCGIVGTLSCYICFTPLHPWWQLFPALLIGPINVGLWLIAPSMQADVADYDELMNNQRREGSFASVFSWAYKVTLTITSGLGGTILVLTGFDVKAGSAQPARVLNNLLDFYVWIPVGFLVVALFAIGRYPLTRSRMQEIRAELELRRGAI